MALRPVNICDDEPASGHEWVPAFCRAVGAPAPWTSPSRHDWARGADNHYAREHLDWKPRYPSWRDGFEAMVHDQEDGGGGSSSVRGRRFRQVAETPFNLAHEACP